ncbi:PAS domain S-box protein [Lysinibacillus yapensis]|nr:PAS domain S-box protein [Lysinibacillus yapensis]
MNFSLNELSIEIYQSIIEHNTDAIFILSANGQILEINKKALDIYGYSKEELKGIHYKEMIVPDYLEKTMESVAQTLSGQHCEYETQVYHKNGEILHLLVKIMPILIKDEIKGIFGVAINRTEFYKTKASLTKTERDLKKSQKNLATIHMALEESSILAITDRKGSIEFANNKFCEISKYSMEELIGQDHRILNSGYHSKEYFREMYRMIGSGKSWKGEIRNKAKDGSFYWVHTTIVPVLDDDGKPCQYVAIRNDITERKQAEEALRQSEERYRKLVELSPDPIIVHTDGILKYVNDAGVKLYGIDSSDEIIERPILDFVHPDYRTAVKQRMHNLKKLGNTVDLLEEKIVRFDGSLMDVEATGVGIHYEGKPSAQLIVRDITDRKLAEEALRQSEVKYRWITEHMTDLVAIIDVNGMVNYASPSYGFLIGYTPQEFEGTVVFDLIHPDDMAFVTQEFLNMIQTKKEALIEFRFKDANGNWVWVESKGTPIYDEHGKFLHALVVSRDISERKVLEEKLLHMAYHDALTDLPNRRLFKERLSQAIKEAESEHRMMAVMYLDMDKFKHINDTLGHDVGDELLMQFGKRVKRNLRQSDILARQGGDEFTILLPYIEHKQEAIQVAERILHSLQEPWQIGNHTFHTTSSIGLAFYSENGLTRNQLMKSADAALYEAKSNGRNNVKLASTYFSDKSSL